MSKIRVEILNPEELSVKQESRWVGVYKDGSVGDTEGRIGLLRSALIEIPILGHFVSREPEMPVMLISMAGRLTTMMNLKLKVIEGQLNMLSEKVDVEAVTPDGRKISLRGVVATGYDEIIYDCLVDGFEFKEI